MLVVFPLGLLGASVLFDLIHLATGSAGAADVACALISAGIVAGLAAAPWGLVDWLAMARGTRARSAAALHGAGHAVVLVLFAASWWWRLPSAADPPSVAWSLSFAGAALALVNAWMAGQRVDRLGVDMPGQAQLDTRRALPGLAEPPDRLWAR